MTFKHDHFDSDSRLSKDSLKQRLIGAIVLVSLAVIFLPMIFDQPHKKQKDLIIPIPEQPPRKVIVIKTPDKPEIQVQEQRNREVIAALSEQAEQSVSKNGTNSSAEANVKQQVARAVTQLTKSETVQRQTDKNVAPSAHKKPKEPTRYQSTPEKSKVKSTSSGESNTQFADKATFAGKWMVQIGSFGSKSNAFVLAGKIKDKGFRSNVIRITAKGKSLSKVLAGPFREESSARSAKKTLDRLFKVKSIVVKY